MVQNMKSLFVSERIQIVVRVTLHTRLTTGSYARQDSVEDGNEIQRSHHIGQRDNASRGTHGRIHAFDLIKPNAGSTSGEWKNPEVAHITERSGGEIGR